MTELPWIERAVCAPYFVTSRGDPWTPIGQNDAISWLELDGLFRRRDLPDVERHLRYLRDSGVTCLRLMLEYAQGNHRFLERPAVRFVPAMVQLWDDLLQICERLGLRVLLTPFDTFFSWVRWRHHPYNAENGGPCSSRTRLLVCPNTREAVKARLAFATRRWGGSGVIFAWGLWNEMHPAQAENQHGAFAGFIDDVGSFLRKLETELHGRADLQCVSVFGPELLASPAIVDPIFRHPCLDFASSHFYESGTIDHPADTVAPAVSVGRLTRAALGHITDLRPFLDSEHGPIHSFKDRHSSLPEASDDEYFRPIQWAHLASGGAGGGMRWPNRSPHVLTPGMRLAQAALSRFLPLVDWPRFRRRNLGEEIGTSGDTVHAFGCGDERQAVIWLLRPDLEKAPVRRGRRPLRQAAQDGEALLTLTVPGLLPSTYEAVLWDTRAGQESGRFPSGLCPPNTIATVVELTDQGTAQGRCSQSAIAAVGLNATVLELARRVRCRACGQRTVQITISPDVRQADAVRADGPRYMAPPSRPPAWSSSQRTGLGCGSKFDLDLHRSADGLSAD